MIRRTARRMILESCETEKALNLGFWGLKSLRFNEEYLRRRHHFINKRSLLKEKMREMPRDMSARLLVRLELLDQAGRD